MEYKPLLYVERFFIMLPALIIPCLTADRYLAFVAVYPELVEGPLVRSFLYSAFNHIDI
jgi:hypothetical protein